MLYAPTANPLTPSLSNLQCAHYTFIKLPLHCQTNPLSNFRISTTHLSFTFVAPLEDHINFLHTCRCTLLYVEYTSQIAYHDFYIHTFVFLSKVTHVTCTARERSKMLKQNGRIKSWRCQHYLPLVYTSSTCTCSMLSKQKPYSVTAVHFKETLNKIMQAEHNSGKG